MRRCAWATCRKSSKLPHRALPSRLIAPKCAARSPLAYRLSNSFVIRAGYGLSYDPYPLAFVRNLLTNYPNDLLLTLSLQKEFWGGFIGQAAYIGTRQLKISQTLDLNADQVLGAGTAGQPFFAKFGRTVQTALLTPVGRNQYDSLQTKLQRRFGNGIQLNAAYTFSKAIGICCDELSDSLPAIQIPQYMYLARALEPFDRPHNFNSF